MALTVIEADKRGNGNTKKSGAIPMSPGKGPGATRKSNGGQSTKQTPAPSPKK